MKIIIRIKDKPLTIAKAAYWDWWESLPKIKKIYYEIFGFFQHVLIHFRKENQPFISIVSNKEGE